MNIEPIQNGVVIDLIEAGRAMQLYKLLNLGSLDASVALIKNVPSKKMGKKTLILTSILMLSASLTRAQPLLL